MVKSKKLYLKSLSLVNKDVGSNLPTKVVKKYLRHLKHLELIPDSIQILKTTQNQFFQSYLLLIFFLFFKKHMYSERVSQFHKTEPTPT